MKNRSLRKNTLTLIQVLVVLIFIGGIYQGAQKAGIGLPLAPREEGVVVSHGARQTLKAGDILIAVDGQQISAIEDVEFLLDSKAIGQPVAFTVQREGHTLRLPYVLVAENSVLYLGTLFLVAVLFFSLSVFVLRKRPPDNEVAMVFFWISVTVGLHIATTFGRFTVGPWHLGYFLRLVFLLASAFTPVLFVHFTFIFPYRKWQRYKKMVTVFYGFSFLFFLILAGLFLRAAVHRSVKQFHDFMLGYNLGRVLFAASLFFGVANFIHSYRNAQEEASRRKLRWVLLGIIIGPLSFVLLWQIPQVISSMSLVPEEALLLLTVFTPLTFAISIVRYHILDIDFIFNRSTVYLMVLGLLLLLYATIVALVALIVGTLTIRASIIASAIAAVIVALLFEPSKKAVQHFVDRKFFRVRYNYRLAQRELTTQLNRFVELNTLARFVVDKLSELLLPKQIALYYLPDKQPVKWQCLAGVNVQSVSPPLEQQLNAFSAHSLKPLMAIKRYLEPGIEFETAEEKLFRENGIVLAMPIRLQNAETCGFLCLGPKQSEAPYSHEDLDLLKTVGIQVGLAMERIRLQQDLLIQHAETQRLNELNRMKSYFISSVSHDLQTPLTSIRMFAELLQTRQDINPSQKVEYLNIIIGESERLSRLINNVLDFSRIERGVKKYTMQDVDLKELAQQVIRSMRFQLQQNGFELDVQLPAKKQMIQADPDAVIEAITNLISNAIKYSPNRKRIQVKVFSRENFKAISVRDWGIGIAPEEQERIFEMFYRSGQNQVKSAGGAGLGLTLVQHIMQAHGGKVQVESNPGEGSTFTLYFPSGEVK